MKLKNIKIKTQVLIGVSVMIILVISMLSVSVAQTVKLRDDLYAMYEHPLTVRNAFWKVKSSALSSSMYLRSMADPSNEELNHELYTEIQYEYQSISDNIMIIEAFYLGPTEDVDNLKKTYIAWKSYRDHVIDSIMEGDYTDVSDHIKVDGESELLRLTFFDAISVIDEFSYDKANYLYSEAQRLSSQLIYQTLAIAFFIIAFAVLIHAIFIRQINEPLEDLHQTFAKVDAGDYSVTSQYESQNELGKLAQSINKTIAKIDFNVKQDKAYNNFSKEILSIKDDTSFIEALLPNLCNTTKAVAGLFYLLDENKNIFKAVSAYGVDIPNTIEDESDFEKQFGFSMFRQKIEVFEFIPEQDSKLLIKTKFADFYPKSVMNIPLSYLGYNIGVIVLATSTDFSSFAISFTENIHQVLSSRIQSIIANQKADEFLKELKEQNRELEAQQNEVNSLNQELEHQNQQLEIQKRILDEVSAHKTNFLSTMSHELRTPLNSVIALSGVLSRSLKDKIPEEEHSYISIIEKNGKNLLAIINDILDISRIESGKEELVTSCFKPCELVRDLVSNYEHLAKDKGVSIILDCSSELDQIISDHDKLSHIIQNLLSNAIKFTEQGTITIKEAIKNGFLILSVEDTGIGMSEEVLPSIFDEFKQADASTSRKYGGTGLGLAIVKKYTEMLGGKVDVFSELGKGTTFTCMIPVEIEEVTTDQSVLTKIKHEVNISSLPDHEIKRILIVDDHLETLQQLKMLLEENQYLVDTAISEEEFVAQIQTHTPDLILLDLIFPKTDGFHLLEIFHRYPTSKETIVLVMSAKEITKEEMKLLKTYHVEKYIPKGELSEEDILLSIYNALFNFESKKPQPREKKPVVLIVEDNPDNMISAMAVMKGLYEIIQAVDGLEGVQKAEEYKPDLILMDIALPGIDGIEAFHRIHEQEELKSIPIIALTASALLQDRKKILAHGFNAFISKPIHAKEFLQKIEEVLCGS